MESHFDPHQPDPMPANAAEILYIYIYDEMVLINFSYSTDITKKVQFLCKYLIYHPARNKLQ